MPHCLNIFYYSQLNKLYWEKSLIKYLIEILYNIKINNIIMCMAFIHGKISVETFIFFYKQFIK